MTTLSLLLLLQLACYSIPGSQAWTTTTTTTVVARKWQSRRLPLPRRHSYLSFSNDNTASSSDGDAQEEAQRLVERAQKARQEAEDMERDLVASRLEKLEGLLESQSQLSKSEEMDLQDRIDRLKNYEVNKDKSNSNQEATVAAAAVETEAATETGSDASSDPEEPPPVYVSELSEDDTKAIEEVQKIYFEFKELLMAAVGNDTSVLIQDSDDAEFLDEMKKLELDFASQLAGNVTEENMELFREAKSLMDGVGNLVTEVLGPNQTVWQDLKQNITRELADNIELVKQDPQYFERLEAMRANVPEEVLSSPEKLNETDMQEFVDRVLLPLNNDVFSLKSKEAKRVGSVYLVSGTPKLANGDALIDTLDEQLVACGLQDKYQVYYVRDTTQLEQQGVELEAMMGGVDQDEEDDEDSGVQFVVIGNDVNQLTPPALMVTSSKVRFEPNPEGFFGPVQRGLLSLVAVFSTASFALNCYSNHQDLNLAQQFTVGFTSPIFLGILAIQAMHELGHAAAAAVHKVKIAFPFVICPSPSTGILHSNTQLASPPKNNNALFDFAISGPLLGMLASIGILLVGLQMTAAAKAGQIASLPHVPLEFFQISTLTSSTIESILGTDVLLSLDPTSDDVAVHPLVIAGHIGILLNALNLLPESNTTDGGRMVMACNTRTVFAVVPVVSKLFLAVQAFRTWDVCNLMAFYLFFAGFIQHNTEVPCRNNVDPADGIRLPLRWATTWLAVIALSPSF